MGEIAAGVDDLRGGDQVAAPANIGVGELKSADVGFGDDIDQLRIIGAVPREDSGDEHVEKSVHDGAGTIGGIGESALRADGMVQAGRGFKSSGTARGVEDELGERLRRRNGIGSETAGADLGEGVIRDVGEGRFAIRREGKASRMLGFEAFDGGRNGAGVTIDQQGHAPGGFDGVEMRGGQHQAIEDPAFGRCGIGAVARGDIGERERGGRVETGVIDEPGEQSAK